MQVQNAKDTTLMGWFKFNQAAQEEYEVLRQANPNAPPPATLSTLYHDMPTIATWNKKEGRWQARRQGVAVGRMYSAMPGEGDRFWVRMLLCHVAGATSFADLRTTGKGTAEQVWLIISMMAHVVIIFPRLEQIMPITMHLFLQIEHPTFKAACIARGLLQDDEEWRQCLQDASISATPHQLRDLFANILVFNDVADPLALWQEFKEDLAEDVLHHARRRNPEQNYDDSIFDKVSVGTGFLGG
jgi:hypothetical protein